MTFALAVGLVVPAAAVEPPVVPVAYPDAAVFAADQTLPVTAEASSVVETLEPESLERVEELVESRTETSSTYTLSDGTFETVLSAGPVHVGRHGSGGDGRRVVSGGDVL